MQAALYAVDGLSVRRLDVSAARLEDLYAGFQLGVYTVFRSYPGCRFIALDHHLARLADSVARVGLGHRIDEPALRVAIDAVCAAASATALRMRIDVLAAAGDLPERELLGHEPLHLPPAEAYRDGVAVRSVALLERADPLAKTAEFAARRAAVAPRDAGIFEQLMCDAEGCITEGLSSSFFAVKDGVLYTAGAGVLDGVTRRIVLDLAARLGVAVRLQPLPLDALPAVQEAFLCSSSRALLPIVAIDGVSLGAGQPGPLTRRLMQTYDEHIEHMARRATFARTGQLR